jgi:hypothetical protein
MVVEGGGGLLPLLPLLLHSAPPSKTARVRDAARSDGEYGGAPVVLSWPVRRPRLRVRWQSWAVGPPLDVPHRRDALARLLTRRAAGRWTAPVGGVDGAWVSG